jgi:hypothetical protein
MHVSPGLFEVRPEPVTKQWLFPRRYKERAADLFCAKLTRMQCPASRGGRRPF